MKQRIIQSIALLVFSTLIIAFVVYRSQFAGKPEKPRSAPKETSQNLVRETNPADTAIHQPAKPNAPVQTARKTNPRPSSSKETEIAAAEASDSLENQELAPELNKEERKVIMSGSKSAVMKDFIPIDFIKYKSKP